MKKQIETVMNVVFGRCECPSLFHGKRCEMTKYCSLQNVTACPSNSVCRDIITGKLGWAHNGDDKSNLSQEDSSARLRQLL